MSMRAGAKKFTVKLVSEKMPHHAGPSGYDILAKHLDASVHYPVSEKLFLSLPFRLIPAAIMRRIVIRGGVQYYYEPRLCDEICLAADWMLHSRRIYHFLYGENGYRYLGVMKRFKPNRIICTFHLPPKRFLEICHVSHHLRLLDGVIVLARHMVDFFSRFLPRERIFFIPYGVDTEFFQPGESHCDSGKLPFCLTVGQHLRDFRALRSVIERVNEQSGKIRFIIVALPEWQRSFSGLRNVTCLSGITDEELRSLYRRATLLLMPLKDTVANTAVLEAMACGLPMVTSDVGGIKDYVDPEFAVLCERGDSAQMSRTVLELCGDAPRRARMQKAARKHALKFDWRGISDRIIQVYEQVAGLPLYGNLKIRDER